MDSSADCTLCAHCVKNCPNDAISLTVRPPTRELWFIRNPRIEASALAVAIMGIVFIQNITMLDVWQSVLGWVRDTTGVTSYPVTFTVAFVVAIGLPAGLLAAAAALARRGGGGSVLGGFASFGYALIPLDVAGHIAHNLFHLLAEGKAVVTTAVATAGGVGGHGSSALVSTATIQVLQYLIVAAGIAGSLVTVWRIARARRGSIRSLPAVLAPYVGLVAVFGVVNLLLFALPMGMRM
jgi:hypothetical protein